MVFLTWPFQYPMSYLVDDELSPERWVGQMCSTPVLFLHGDRDRVVPWSHSERLHELTGEPKGFWTVRGAAHTQAMTNPELRATLLERLDTILTQGAGVIPSGVVETQ